MLLRFTAHILIWNLSFERSLIDMEENLIVSKKLC